MLLGFIKHLLCVNGGSLCGLLVVGICSRSQGVGGWDSHQLCSHLRHEGVRRGSNCVCLFVHLLIGLSGLHREEVLIMFVN